MTIWIIAGLCAGLGALAGYARGMIRSAMALCGLLLGLILAPFFGPLLVTPMRAMINNILVADALAPLVVFVAVSIAFRVAGNSIQQKVHFHFRYRATDTRLLHFERVSARVGGAVGLMNGTVYFYLLCSAFYIAGYLTTQMTDEDKVPRTIRLINRVSYDLDATGMRLVLAPIVPMPQAYYEAADILGLVFHNRQLLSRLGRYPFFLSMAERPEFQEMAGDPRFNEMLQTSFSIADLLRQPDIKKLLANAEFIEELHQLDLADLRAFVETGVSPRYQSTRILGRWVFDYSSSLEQTRLIRSDISPGEMFELNRELGSAFLDSTLVATIDGAVFLKGIPTQPPEAGQPAGLSMPTGPQRILAQGRWTESSGEYTVTFETVDSGTAYQRLQGGTRVRFANDSTLVLERDNVALEFAKEI